MYEFPVVDLGYELGDRLGDDRPLRQADEAVIPLDCILDSVPLTADLVQHGDERVHLFPELRVDFEDVGLTCPLPEAKMTGFREDPHRIIPFCLLANSSTAAGSHGRLSPS